MLNSFSGLLTIQKFIYLLDDFHYNEFSRYLSATNAQLPLALAEAIRNKLPDFDTHEELCTKLYGGFGKVEKQNFNQLSFHTFKLSQILAINYPDYLHHNISKIQRLVNSGKKQEVDLLADSLLEIAARVEDIQCQIFVLKFLSQRAFLIKDTTNAFKLNKQLEEAIAKESFFIRIQSTFRNAVYVPVLSKDPDELERLRNYYLQFHHHPSPGIRILSRFAYLITMYYLSPYMFTEPEDVKRLKELERDLQNHSYIVFPFMSDFKWNIGFLKLNSPLTDINSKEGQKTYDQLVKHYSSVKFWKNYIHVGEIHLIAIQVTRLLTTYHARIHRDDYHNAITPKDLALVRSLVAKCEEFVNRKGAEEYYEYERMSFKMLHGILLLLSGGEHIKKGLNELESLLITYQQLNTQASTDSVYLCLMVGYFSIKAYDKCNQTFKRYIKVVKNKPVFQGNYAMIYGYYYLSQWLSTGSRQYPAKLQTLLKQNQEDDSLNAFSELIKYFKVPVKLNVPNHPALSG